MNIKEFLLPNIQWEIKAIEENPYYLPMPGDKGVSHAVLELTPIYRDDENEDWRYQSEVYPLCFYWSGYGGLPSIERFSLHIYDECRAALNSFDWYYYERNYWKEMNQILPSDVWRFLKNLHKDYRETERFLADYDYWKYRLYADLKWIAYMSGALTWLDSVSIGDRLYDFLEFKNSKG
jgi:hypothetical protein